MRVLIAIDFSQATSILLSEVKKFAEFLSAKFWLIHVAAPDPDFAGYELGPQCMRDEAAREFRKEHVVLQREVQAFRDMGMEATALMVQGRTAETILKEADNLKAELIIIGSHGHGAVYHLLVGSVSEHVLRKAKCPILVVPTHARV